MKKPISAIVNYCKNNTRLVLMCLGALLLNTGIFISSVNDFPSGKLGKALLAIAFLVTNAIAIYGIIIANKKKYPIEKVFLIFGLLYGLMMVFALPIGRVPDEPSHFWRAYELSELKFFTKTTEDGQVGHYLPNNIKALVREDYTDDAYAEIWSHIHEPADSERSYQRGPADNYFVMNYIPQVLGIWVGRAMGLPLIPIAYLARVFNLVFCVLIVYFCIKFTPAFKKIIFLIAFMPMTMQAFASVSADGSIICGSLILVCFTLYMMRGTKRKITKRDYALITAACLMLAVTKPVYAPLCFILFFIPKERFGNNKKKILSIMVIGALTIACYLLISLTFPASTPRFEAGPAGQLDFILNNPLKFTKYLATAMMQQIMFFITRGIGASLEWFTVSIAEINILLYVLGFVLVCAEGEFEAKASLKLFAGIAFVVSTALIFVALYLAWSETASPVFDGVQGRYFLPLTILIPIFFSPTKKSTKSLNNALVKNQSLYTLAFFTMSQVIVAIISTHI